MSMDHYRVCIVGAGTAGVGVAKQLLWDEKVPLNDIIVVDESSGVGGVWNRDHREIELDGVPSSCMCSGSPVYDDLHTNLPKDSMSFSDFHYPIESWHYPPHTTVLTYLKDYAEKFVPSTCIHFNTSVKQIQKTGEKWNIKCCVSKNSENRQLTFTSEYVIVCTGHFRYPKVPIFKESLNKNSCIDRIHSSSFRRPSTFAKYKNILVIGSRASAKDICLLLLKHSASHNTGQTIFVTIRCGFANMSRGRQAFFRSVLTQGAHERGEVEYIDHQAGEVTFSAVRGSGQKSLKESIDLIIYATGYVNKYPFLDDGGFSHSTRFHKPDRSVNMTPLVAKFPTSNSYGHSDSDSDSSSDSEDESESETTGAQSAEEMPPLLHRIVSLADPTLMFVGTLNHLFTPCIVIEYQARYVAQLISGKIQLPSNYTSLLRSVTFAKSQLCGITGETLPNAAAEKKILVGKEKVLLSEFIMDANFNLSDNPYYCNKLARLTGSQGFWSQLFCQRLSWLLSSFLYQLTRKMFPRFSKWLAKR